MIHELNIDRRPMVSLSGLFKELSKEHMLPLFKVDFWDIGGDLQCDVRLSLKM